MTAQAGPLEIWRVLKYLKKQQQMIKEKTWLAKVTLEDMTIIYFQVWLWVFISQFSSVSKMQTVIVDMNYDIYHHVLDSGQYSI